MSPEDQAERRATPRICLDAGVDVFVDAEISGASSLDVSQTGLRFSAPEPLVLELHLSVDGEREERTAKLVWARQMPDGAVHYGLEFVEDGLPMDPVTGTEASDE